MQVKTFRCFVTQKQKCPLVNYTIQENYSAIKESTAEKQAYKIQERVFIEKIF